MRGDKNQPNDSQKSDGLWDGSNENNKMCIRDSYTTLPGQNAVKHCTVTIG